MTCAASPEGGMATVWNGAWRAETWGGHDTKVASASGSSEQIGKICPFSRPPISLSALASPSRALAGTLALSARSYFFELFLLPDTQSTFVS
jgi:hypothetical protein